MKTTLQETATNWKLELQKETELSQKYALIFLVQFGFWGVAEIPFL